MKSKIGKLGKIGDVSESAEYKFLTRVINEIIEKQGKIIDHLNSQDQPEENEPEKVYVDPIVPNFTEELIKRKLKKITTSERVGFLYAVGDDDLLADELYDYIEQLLDKAREEELEWVLKNCSGGGNWRRIVNQRLSKLKDNK